MLRLCFFVSLNKQHHNKRLPSGLPTLRHRLSAYMSYGTGYRHTCPTAPVIIFIGKLLSFLAKRNPYLHFVFPRVAFCIHLVTQSAMDFVSQQDCECFPIEYNTLCLVTDFMFKNASSFLPRCAKCVSAFHYARLQSAEGFDSSSRDCTHDEARSHFAQ